jgi:hypothetical protein
MTGQLLKIVMAGMVVGAIIGCDQQTSAPSQPAPTVGPPPPPPPPPTDGTVTPSTPLVPSGAGPAAFLAANKEVLAIMEQMQDRLAAAVDDATAQQVAQKLPGLTDRWEVAQKGATALFLTLSDQQQREVMATAQNEALAGGKPMKEDLLAAMQRLAASPQRPIVETALVDLRDTILAQHSIYATVVMRRKLAEKLGEAGSPLP